MPVLVRVVVGLLLVAHGVVHLLYRVDDVPEFSLEDPWLLPATGARTLADVLMVATVIGFVLLALAVWGVPGIAGAWPVIAVAASVSSLVLLALFPDGRLWAGVVIDVALIATAAWRPEWTDPIG